MPHIKYVINLVENSAGIIIAGITLAKLIVHETNPSRTYAICALAV